MLVAAKSLIVSRLAQRSIATALLFTAQVSSAVADNKLYHVGVDKVYHPYVQPLEHELDVRGAYQFDDDEQQDGVYVQRVGIGAAVSDRLFVEGYVIGKETPAKDFSLEAYELEAKLQLTEQGEFAVDWGLLFEFAKSRRSSVSELAITLLSEKEWGRWVGTTNITLEYEYGDDIDDELDRSVAAQLRYRYSRSFEPSVEVYIDEFTRAVGPVLLGEVRFGNNNKLMWELGLLLGLSEATADQTVKMSLEYEF